MTQASSWEASHRVSALTFSPDGRHLVVTSSSLGDTLEMFDVETGARVWKRGARTANRGDVAFTPDGRFLVTGWGEGFVLASADGRKMLYQNEASETSVQHSALSPDGRRLVTAIGPTIRVYDVASGAKTLGLRVAFNCEGISFSPDGTRAAMLGKDGIHVWDAALGQQQLTLHPPTKVDSMVFGRCGHVLVTSDKEHVVRVWDVGTGTQRRQLETGTETTGLSFSADGRLALTSGGGTLRIWDVMAGYERTRLPAPARLGDATLNDGGTRLATATGRSVVISQVGGAATTMIGEPAQADGCPWCGAPETQLAPAQDTPVGVDLADPGRSSSGDLSRGGHWAVEHAAALAAGLATLVFGAIIFGMLTGQVRIAAAAATVPVFVSTFLFRTWDAQQAAPTKARKAVAAALTIASVALILVVLIWIGPGGD